MTSQLIVLIKHECFSSVCNKFNQLKRDGRVSHQSCSFDYLIGIKLYKRSCSLRVIKLRFHGNGIINNLRWSNRNIICFVIMLLNITSENLEININNLLPLVLLIVLSIIVQVSVTGKSNISHSLELEIIQPINLSNPQILASKFYSMFDIYLILPSLILLVAMVGTIVLILSHNQTSKKQDLFIQTTRDKHNIRSSSYSNTN